VASVAHFDRIEIIEAAASDKMIVRSGRPTFGVRLRADAKRADEVLSKSL
jgi:hypothetical protein